MSNRLFLLSTVASILFAGYAAAQDTTTTEAPAEDAAPAAPLTKETAEIGQAYRTTNGDWNVDCEKTLSGNDPCLMVQVLRDDANIAVMETEVTRLPSGNGPAAVLLIKTPLMTLLPEGVTLSIDGGDPARIPFLFCDSSICMARANLREQDVAAFKRGVKAALRIVPVAAPDQSVTVDMSLSGFTASYDGLPELGGQ
jgi:invasion protein IalB